MCLRHGRKKDLTSNSAHQKNDVKRACTVLQIIVASKYELLRIKEYEKGFQIAKFHSSSYILC